MKLKLVGPCANKLRFKGKTPKELSGIRNKQAPWGLCCIAALTPDSWEISIEDEMMDELVLDDHADLVGITVISAASSPRAYEIGDHFRKRGIPVVMGGIFASAMPEETLKHADAVVIGEAEGAWYKVLDDFVNKKMQGIYRSDHTVELTGLPRPRLDLLKHRDEYDIWQYVQPARGCPYKCEFCSTTAFWKTFRKRPVDEVIEELRHLDPNKPIMVMDEFVGVDRVYYKELFEKMIPLQLKWWSCQTGVKMADDPEMMDLLQKAGCRYVFLGLESPNVDSLIGEGKRHNDPKKYLQAIKTFHEKGMIIQGAFVFGLDSDDYPGTFRRVHEFIKKSDLDMVQFNLVYPYPGTPLRERFMEDNRITSNDFDNYIFDGINYLPKSMTQEQLNKGYNWVLRKNASLIGTFIKILKKLLQGKTLPAYAVWLTSKGTRRSYMAVKESRKRSNPIHYPAAGKSISM